MKTKAQKPAARDYLKVVEWSDEDGVFVGSAPPLIGQCCHGANETKVFAELGEIVDEWIRIHEEDGLPLPEGSADKEYSGKFLLRLKPELHKALAIEAMKERKSLNALIEERLR